MSRHQRVLSAVSGRAVILALDAVKLLQHDIVDLPLLREKRNRHLMDAANVLSRDLLKGAGDDRLSQQPIQFVGVVDVLISLSHAKDGDFLRQMGVCEQGGSPFYKRGSALRNRDFPCAPYPQTVYRSCKASGHHEIMLMELL